MFCSLIYVALALGTATACAQTPRPEYSHLLFTAELMQEQMPIPAVKGGHRPIVDMKKTKFAATIELYFAPGDPKAPAFARARYTVRSMSHAWQTIDSGFQTTTLHPVDVYEELARGSVSISTANSPLPAGMLDYSETPMPPNSWVFSAMQIRGSIWEFLAKAVQLHDPTIPLAESTPSIEVHIAIPIEYFAQASSEFKTQARLSFEYYNLSNRPLTIMYRKMLYGTARTAALNEEQTEELNRLLQLHESCENDVTSGDGRSH